MFLHFEIKIFLIIVYILPLSLCELPQIRPHTSIFPSPVSKILWAGTNQNQDCNELCKDSCLKNSLGENCFHLCGCVLGRNILYLLLSSGHLFRSTDMGKIWDDETDSLRQTFDKSTKLNKHLNSLKSNEDFILIKDIIPNSENPNIFWFLGHSAINWKTEDAGASYSIWYIEIESVGYVAKVSSILLHPIRNTSLLATTMNPEACEDWTSDSSVECKQRLHVSHDAGKTWDLVDENVLKFEWGNAGKYINMIETRYHQHYVFGRKITGLNGGNLSTVDWSTIYFSKKTKKNEQKSEVMMICNKWWLKDGREFSKCSEILQNLHSFNFFGNYIYLAYFGSNQEVKILVSHNLDKYTAITFSENSNPVITSFTFFEDKHGLMFLYINEKDHDYGTLYRSDYTGQRFTRMLPNLHRCPHNQLDFLEFTSLDGVFLANIVLLKTVGNEVEEKIQTVISYDNGAKWHYLLAPRFDPYGKPLTCGYKDQCHLHLALTQHHRKARSIITNPKSIGIILALGNLGSELIDEIDALHTFLSIDGGVTWKFLDTQPSFLNFGDIGSLLILASQDFQLKYSWNMGANWTELSLKNINEQSTITNVLSHPLSNAQEFLIIGEIEASTSGERRSGIVVLLDFSELNPDQCQKSFDYEIFIPKAYEESCILGRKVSYLRKIPDRNCYNGMDFEPIEKQENCECTSMDYECDWGFYKVNGVCEPISLRMVQTNFTIECYNLHNKHYLYSLGYRKILGNSCEGKTVFDPILLECPIYYLGLSKSQIIWIFISIMIFTIIMIGYNKWLLIKMRALSYWGNLTHRSTISKDDIVFNDTSYNEEESSDLIIPGGKSFQNESP